MSIVIDLLLGIWTVVALLMMLVILMQRPKSEGLGAAFGSGVTENIFGAQTTNVLVKFTAWLAGIFFVVSFALSILYAHMSMRKSSLGRELSKSAGTPAPLASPAPSGAPKTTPAASAVPSAKPAASAPAAAPSASVNASPASSPKKP
jgi:preprotein translocase subunit SecG